MRIGARDLEPHNAREGAGRGRGGHYPVMSETAALVTRTRQDQHMRVQLSRARGTCLSAICTYVETLYLHCLILSCMVGLRQQAAAKRKDAESKTMWDEKTMAMLL
jgi:hypothetical protein